MRPLYNHTRRIDVCSRRPSNKAYWSERGVIQLVDAQRKVACTMDVSQESTSSNMNHSAEPRSRAAKYDLWTFLSIPAAIHVRPRCARPTSASSGIGEEGRGAVYVRLHSRPFPHNSSKSVASRFECSSSALSMQSKHGSSACVKRWDVSATFSCDDEPFGIEGCGGCGCEEQLCLHCQSCSTPTPRSRLLLLSSEVAR